MRRFIATSLSMGFISLFALTSCEDSGGAISANNQNKQEQTVSITYPTDRKYSDNHQWVKIDANGIARVGVTPEAIDELGGEVESVSIVEESTGDPSNPDNNKRPKGTLEEILNGKSGSGKKKNAYFTVGGSHFGRNTTNTTSPNQIATDPMGAGWLFELDDVDLSDYNNLMTASEYETFISGSGN